MAYINGNEILFSAIINGIGEGNQWCGEYVDGTGYKTGAIVSYNGNVYICIKDLDDMQDPTNAEYWDMINEENVVEVIPEGYIKPTGTKAITENGTHDVAKYESVKVNVPTGSGTDTSDATARLGDILDGKTAYVNGEKIEGVMPNNAYYEGDYILELDASKPSETLYGAYNGTAMINLEELTGDKAITENGTYEASEGKVISKVTVAVEGEVLPEISEPLTLIATKEGAEEGELVIAYNLSQKSALLAGTNAPLGFVQDANFLPQNIKKDEVVFGLRGEYEGGGGAELNIAYGDTAPEDTSKLWVKTSEPSELKISSQMRKTEGENLNLSVSGTLSKSLYMGNCVRIEEKIYIFGGTPSDRNEVQVFDSTTQSCTVLTAKMPVGISGGASVLIDGKIYIFGGGYNGGSTSIMCFDVASETFSTLSVTLPSKFPISFQTTTIGSCIYIIYSKVCYCLDVELQTITTLPVTINTTFNFGIDGGESNIYLFSREEGVYYFDAVAQTLTSLGITLPDRNVVGVGIAKNNSRIYWFGGYLYENSVYTLTNAVRYFDIDTREIGTLNVTLTSAVDGCSCATVDDKIYVFGGDPDKISSKVTDFLQTIWCFSPDLIPLLENGKVQVVPSTNQNLFNLINTENIKVEIGVNKVYKGNADGIAEEVETALHNGTSWVTI